MSLTMLDDGRDNDDCLGSCCMELLEDGARPKQCVCLPAGRLCTRGFPMYTSQFLRALLFFAVLDPIHLSGMRWQVLIGGGKLLTEICEHMSQHPSCCAKCTRGARAARDACVEGVVQSKTGGSPVSLSPLWHSRIPPS